MNKNQQHIERLLKARCAKEWCQEQSRNRSDFLFDQHACKGDSLIPFAIANQAGESIYCAIQIDETAAVIKSAMGNHEIILPILGDMPFNQSTFEDALCQCVEELAHMHGDTILDETNSALDETNGDIVEGALHRVSGDAYERSRKARELCIKAHGASCAICGFDFKKAYGLDFAGMIQVHHIVPLHQTEAEHKVDPISDLIPVCANCHMAIHKNKDQALLPEELKTLIQRAQEQD